MATVLVLYILAFSIGLVAFTLCILFSVKYRHRTLRHVGLFYAALLLMMPRMGLQTLKIITGHPLPPAIDFLRDLMYTATIFLFSSHGPLMIRSIFGNPFGPPRAGMLIAASAILGGSYLALARFWPNFRFAYCMDILGIWAPMFYMIFIAVRTMRKIPKELVGAPGILSLCVPLVFFLLNIPDWVGLPIPLMDYRLPVFFIVESSLGIVIAAKYFLVPFVDSRGNGISEDFAALYSLSEREIDVINEVIKGLSSQEIGDRLFISAKTVENHLGNIYQKTKTKNRYQLFTLVHDRNVKCGLGVST